MALYTMGASWNPDMSQYNRQIKRQLSGVGGLSFSYRLNRFGPKVGPPMIPANLALDLTSPLSVFSAPITAVESFFGMQNPQTILQAAYDEVNNDVKALPATLSKLQSYLTQLQAYDSNSSSTIVNQVQALEQQVTGLVNVAEGWQTLGGTVLGKISTAQSDPTTTKDQANDLKYQADAFHDQINTMNNQISDAASAIVSFLKSVGASPSAIQAVENTLISSVGTLTWIIGGSLVAYFLLPTFLPRLAGGIRKSIHAGAS